MRMQRNSTPPLDQVPERGAAVQHDFPETSIQHGQIARKPNWSFAARVPNFLHAGQARR